MKPTILELNQVSLNFAGIPVLNKIDYHIQAEDFVVILGSNGSGKSSLLKCINRHYAVSSGSIWLDGIAMHAYPEKTFRHTLKTLTQNCDDSLFLSLTILENYLLVKHTHEPDLFSLREGVARKFCADYLRKFNANLPDKLDQVAASLSGGEKQALTLAFTMLYPPKILLLDEHTSALDPKSAASLMRLTQTLAKEHAITCVLTTHDLTIAEAYGNRILALRGGMIHQQIEHLEKQTLNQKTLLAACY